MSEETPTTPPMPPKADPETLVLRGRPGRVVRFRRGAIIAISAVGSALVIGTAWIALEPATFHLIAAGDDDHALGARPPADALADAPKSYGDVPKLGPPLPGDLGKPILDHQQATGMETPVGSDDQAAQAAEAERQRRAAELKAARESAVMVQLASAKSVEVAIGAPAVSVPASDEVTKSPAPIDPAKDPNAQQHKAAFLAAKDDAAAINPHVLTDPVSPCMLMAGSIIPASLITGLNSDLPGLVSAQVTENVYDSATGRILLIPQGARLIGHYESVIAYGQTRALVVWQRIVLPDGSSIRIDNMPASDMAGYAGLSDKVDAHTWQIVKGAALSTLLGIGTQITASDESDLVRAARESMQQNASHAGDKIVSKTLDVQPTIRVRPGWPLTVVVNRDLILRPWRGAGR